MVANKHIAKIIVAVMAVAVVLCLLASVFSGAVTDWFGGRAVRMEYESSLFDTDEIITVDIKMDEADWNSMLKNASSEEYYCCDVTVNGKTVKNVAIRPKGNTSLSAIAMDPDTDRFSLKLEFDHYVKGQTCFGLDKLILNNNYADATNMKEAIIYDMFQYLGADASLYNYAKVSVNGEYWGVYLALEAVEDSFMLRNFGTQDGELYKPDSMEMGGGKSDGDSGNTPSMPGGDFPGGMTLPGGDNSGFNPGESSSAGSFPGGMTPPGSDNSGFDPDESSRAGSVPGNTQPSAQPSDGSGFDPGESSSAGSVPGNAQPSAQPSDGSGFDPGESSSAGDFSGGNGGNAGFDPGSMPDMGGAPGGGFSMGSGGANLNYTDDSLDSYSTIWDGEITKTGKSDHRKVVTALQHISEGTDLEMYLDVDNVLRYMAVHTFSVNMDSLSGSMAHNYYLYEYDGQLNILPWDYNLSFGGMSMGSDASATEMVNDAIDTPFDSTKFFDALLENEEYLAKYHEYLRQLCEEYVNGGRFEEIYTRIRSQIDRLVETDPTAFYSYSEYDAAAETLYEVVTLRAKSILGQLDGSIPSTDAGQKQDPSALIDASHIDLSVMGKFNMGGDFGSRNNRPNRKPSSVSSDAESQSGPPDGFDFSSLSFDFGSSPGAPGQSTSQTKTGLILCGVMFAVILIPIILLLVIKRKR